MKSSLNWKLFIEEIQYAHLPLHITGGAEPGPNDVGAVLLNTRVLGSSMTETDAISQQCLGIKQQSPVLVPKSTLPPQTVHTHSHPFCTFLSRYPPV